MTNGKVHHTPAKKDKPKKIDKTGRSTKARRILPKALTPPQSS